VIEAFINKKGWKITEQRTGSQRFLTFLIETPQGPRFFKASNPKSSLSREVETEVWWNLTLERIVQQLPQKKKIFRGPHVHAYGSEDEFSWYLAEYFDASLLVDLKAEKYKNQIHKELENIVDVLVTLDKVRVETLPATSLYSEEGESSPYNNLLKKVDRWLEKPLKAKLITPERVEQGKALIERCRPFVYPALQHGDFVPWHMFRLLKEKVIGIVDGEHASLVKPRFYDLAYLYTRLYTKAHVPAKARKSLNIFLEKSELGRKEFFQSFLPVITLRSFGMHLDAINDKDYHREAQELLNLCLEEKLPKFL
jgi:aminoglycoside phosphotransferase (APT) family kinase protein